MQPRFTVTRRKDVPHSPRHHKSKLLICKVLLSSDPSFPNMPHVWDTEAESEKPRVAGIVDPDFSTQLPAKGGGIRRSKKARFAWAAHTHSSACKRCLGEEWARYPVIPRCGKSRQKANRACWEVHSPLPVRPVAPGSCKDSGKMHCLYQGRMKKKQLARCFACTWAAKGVDLNRVSERESPAGS